MKAGLNLFSLRQLAQTEEEFLKLALRLKEIGYSYLQVSGVPLSAQAIARVSKESGLPVHLTHSPLDKILNEPQKLMAENAVFGCKYIGLGYFPPELIAKEKECKETVLKFNRVAEEMKKNGFTLFLHHHHNEFYRYAEGTMLDFVLQNAPDVHFIADTYWLQYGGVTPAAYLQKMNGRVECVHLKDYRLRPKQGEAWCEPHFAPVGEGTLDFPAIVKAAKAAGTEYFFVEQDDAGEYPDAIGEVKKSIEYIKENL